ncbi:MAG: V-type ATP synthase subunit F [Deltaproteobacteria bacterium]|jgi:vacuolar-type H+-ATPase subunit F/Vma7|nr:V-type ATP synthase subunit F [Deltaproteobacteria bacterium]
MNKRIVFFTENDARHGFGLAGFEHHVCTSEELPALLEQFIQKSEYGLFIIDERLVTENIENWLREMEKNLDLVFVILPPPLNVEAKREDYAVRLLKKAIGYHVQLNI